MRVFWRLIFVLLLITLFLGMTRSLIYEKGLTEPIPLVFMFGLIPYSFYKGFQDKEKSNKYILLIAVAMAIGLGVTWGNWIKFIEDRKLTEQGEFTKGIITKAWITTGPNGRIENLLKAKFFYGNDKIETFSHKNTKGLKVATP